MDHIKFVREKVREYESNSFLRTPRPRKNPLIPAVLESEADSGGSSVEELPAAIHNESETPSKAVKQGREKQRKKPKAQLEVEADPPGEIATPLLNPTMRKYSRKKKKSRIEEIIADDIPQIATPDSFISSTDSSVSLPLRSYAMTRRMTLASSSEPSPAMTPVSASVTDDSLTELFDWGEQETAAFGLAPEFVRRMTPQSATPQSSEPENSSSRQGKKGKAKLKILKLKHGGRPALRKLNEAFIDLTDPTQSEQEMEPKVKRKRRSHRLRLKSIAENGEDSDDTVSVEASAETSSGTDAADPFAQKDWASFNCLISKSESYFSQLKREMERIRDPTKFTGEHLNWYTRKTFRKFLPVLTGEELADETKHWRHTAFMAQRGKRNQHFLGQRLVLMSNPHSHFTDQQQDVCAYVLNAVITASMKENHLNRRFPLHSDVDIVDYLSEVMLPEILFRLYAKVKGKSYEQMRLITQTTKDHTRGKASS